jgi:hypothetical protein
MSFRTIHRRIAIAMSVPIIMTIGTGFTYRFARNVLSVDKQSVKWLMSVHVMSVWGIQSIYPLIVGLSMIGLIIAGLPMTPIRMGCQSMYQSIVQSLNRSSKPNNSILQTSYVSMTHQWFGLIAAIPLSISSLTGIVWTLHKYWLTDSDSLTDKSRTLKDLMSYHQGSIYGSSAVYCSIIFMLSLPVIISGCLMLPYMRRFRSSNQSFDQSKYSMLGAANDRVVHASQHKSLLEIDTDSEEDGI